MQALYIYWNASRRKSTLGGFLISFDENERPYYPHLFTNIIIITNELLRYNIFVNESNAGKRDSKFFGRTAGNNYYENNTRSAFVWPPVTIVTNEQKNERRYQSHSRRTSFNRAPYQPLCLVKKKQKHSGTQTRAYSCNIVITHTLVPRNEKNKKRK